MKLGEPKSDREHDRLAQRMAKLEEKLFAVMERTAELEAENARLPAEVERSISSCSTRFKLISAALPRPRYCRQVPDDNRCYTVAVSYGRSS